MNKTYTNNESKKNYRIAIDSKMNDTVILANVDTTDKKTLVFTHEGLEEAVKNGVFTVKEAKKTELAKKCNKQSTTDILHKFEATLHEEADIEEHYIIKREDAKANKFLLVYVNPSTKKFRNIAELFCKVRASIMSIFIREEAIANGIEYDAELANVHKAHNYNFWIEASTTLEADAIREAVRKMIDNHKKSITA